MCTEAAVTTAPNAMRPSTWPLGVAGKRLGANGRSRGPNGNIWWERVCHEKQNHVVSLKLVWIMKELYDNYVHHNHQFCHSVRVRLFCDSHVLQMLVTPPRRCCRISIPHANGTVPHLNLNHWHLLFAEIPVSRLFYMKLRKPWWSSGISIMPNGIISWSRHGRGCSWRSMYLPSRRGWGTWGSCSCCCCCCGIWGDDFSHQST